MSSKIKLATTLEAMEVRPETKRSDIAIQVQGLSKCYQIYEKPHDRLKQSFLPRFQRLAGLPTKQYFQDFWAVKNVSLDVARGETVGIIGSNGGGKSTLLQMICGTLNPTGGTIKTNGRVAALLELGSGFNPEFTGRENVNFNAMVLGLSREEIDARFDDIIAFADIGSFVDQQVKTYSSGMMVRLAFAVIAHVDADILVIDEALSVGDAVFTQKCMRWLRNFQKRGTVLFVSHDTSSVRGLCDRAIWLNHGECVKVGPAKDVTEAYLKFTYEKLDKQGITFESLDQDEESEPETQPEAEDPKEQKTTYGMSLQIEENLASARGWKTGKAEIVSVQLENKSDPDVAHFQGGEKVCVRVRARCVEAISRPAMGFLVRDRLGQDLFGENTLQFTNASPVHVPANGIVEAEFHFTLPMLPNGHYEVMASIADGTLEENVQHHWLNDALIFHVSSSTVRWGLVGIPFDHVSMEALDD